ncbi:MAG: hypothetical protein ACYCQK_02650 [Acidiferrobacteraceae bacterium]
MRKPLILLLLAAVSLGASAGLRQIRTGALGGNAAMQLQLGELYQYGFGLHDHDIPALAWYLVAAHSRAPGAKARAEALARTMGPAARAAAHRKSEALLQRIHAAGSTVSSVPPLQSPNPSK